MFSRNKQLTREEIGQISKIRSSKISLFFNVKYLKNDTNSFRYACVLSKKDYRLSVTRHRVKRIFKEALRFFEQKKGVFAVFYIKKGCEKLKTQDLISSIGDVLDQI